MESWVHLNGGGVAAVPYPGPEREMDGKQSEERAPYQVTVQRLHAAGGDKGRLVHRPQRLRLQEARASPNIGDGWQYCH